MTQAPVWSCLSVLFNTTVCSSTRLIRAFDYPRFPVQLLLAANLTNFCYRVTSQTSSTSVWWRSLIASWLTPLPCWNFYQFQIWPLRLCASYRETTLSPSCQPPHKPFTRSRLTLSRAQANGCPFCGFTKRSLFAVRRCTLSITKNTSMLQCARSAFVSMMCSHGGKKLSFQTTWKATTQTFTSLSFCHQKSMKKQGKKVKLWTWRKRL